MLSTIETHVPERSNGGDVAFCQQFLLFLPFRFSILSARDDQNFLYTERGEKVNELHNSRKRLHTIFYRLPMIGCTHYLYYLYF